ALFFHGSLEQAADDAFLSPRFSFRKLAVLEEAGHLRARAGAAGRAVVRLSRAEDEVLAVGVRAIGRPEKLDMIDHRAVLPGDPVFLQALPDSPRHLGQPLVVAQADLLAMLIDEIEPVPTPGNVAGEAAVALHIDGNILPQPVA